MARVLGGSVARAPKAELGWYQIKSYDTSLIEEGPWFQYHWDRWQLPAGATEIARTEIASQAFTYGRTLGLQFHPEIDGPTACLWAAEDAAFVTAANGPQGVAQLQATSLAAAERTAAHRRRLLAQALAAVTA